MMADTLVAVAEGKMANQGGCTSFDSNGRQNKRHLVVRPASPKLANLHLATTRNKTGATRRPEATAG